MVWAQLSTLHDCFSANTQLQPLMRHRVCYLRQNPDYETHHHFEADSPTMSNQACHFLRLPVEVRLIIYDHVLDTQDEATLSHPLSHVSEQISDEIMPLLLRRVSGFFWTAIPCHEEWFLAIQPFKKIWRMRLINAVEKPLNAVPMLRTNITYHVVMGRHLGTAQHLGLRLQDNKLTGGFLHTDSFYLESEDQNDGVKRLVRVEIDGRHGRVKALSSLWIERGRTGAPEMNEKLTERVWHEQWSGGGRRGPRSVLMCVFQKLSGQQS